MNAPHATAESAHRKGMSPLPDLTGLILGSDIDGVLYRLIEPLREWFITEHGYLAEDLPDPPTYAIESHWGFSHEVFLRELIQAATVGRLFREGAAYEDGRDTIRQVRGQGCSVALITARNLPGIENLCREATAAWAETERIEYDSLHLTHDKNTVAFDLLADDYDMNVRAAHTAGRNAVLIDRPWNTDIVDLPLTSWADVPAHLAALAGTQALQAS